MDCGESPKHAVGPPNDIAASAARFHLSAHPAGAAEHLQTTSSCNTEGDSEEKGTSNVATRPWRGQPTMSDNAATTAAVHALVKTVCEYRYNTHIASLKQAEHDLRTEVLRPDKLTISPFVLDRRDAYSIYCTKTACRPRQALPPYSYTLHVGLLLATLYGRCVKCTCTVHVRNRGACASSLTCYHT